MEVPWYLQLIYSGLGRLILPIYFSDSYTWLRVMTLHQAYWELQVEGNDLLWGDDLTSKAEFYGTGSDGKRTKTGDDEGRTRVQSWAKVWQVHSRTRRRLWWFYFRGCTSLALHQLGFMVPYMLAWGLDCVSSNEWRCSNMESGLSISFLSYVEVWDTKELGRIGGAPHILDSLADA